MPGDLLSCGDGDSLPTAADTDTSSSSGQPKTPTRKVQYKNLESVAEDTPAKARFTLTPEYQNGNLDSMRSSVAKDIGQVFQISIDTFKKHLLPPLKDGIDVSRIASLLREDESIISSLDGGLKDFQPSPCKRSSAHEDEVFAPLANIWDKISRLALRSVPETQRNFTPVMLPNYTPLSERASSTRPDAYFVRKKVGEFARVAVGRKGETKKERNDRRKRMQELKEDGKGIHWYDIGACFEFKKEVGDRCSNEGKLALHIQHIMAVDPCRRFTFGVTIEDTQMRLWFCSRSDPVVSEPFDFTVDVECLVHVLLSFLFASEEELGWDPTIQPVIGSNGKRAYLLEVGDNTFETEQVISDIGADSLLSRGTRVWKATHIESGKTVVVKDVWVEEDRELEHVIREAILNDIERQFEKKIKQEAAKYLLTPIAHCLVQVNGMLDNTNGMLRGCPLSPSDKIPFNVEKETKVVGTRQSTGPPSASDLDGHVVQMDPAHVIPTGQARLGRAHYRIVFDEVAKPLYTVRILSEVFLVLRDSAKVLEWIHECGWVHRDLSVGNLYFYDGRGLVGDLEYAKHKHSNSIHPIRTATTDFVAVEALKREYMFTATRLLTIQMIEEYAFLSSEDSAPFIFSHNALHDMESLWWIAIYELFFNRDSREASWDEEYTSTMNRKRRDFAHKIFPRTDQIEGRMPFLQSEEDYRTGTSWMIATFGKLSKYLNLLRILLVNNYRASEARLPMIQQEAFKGTQEMFRKIFEKCMDLAVGVQLMPYRNTRTCLDNGTVGQETQSTQSRPQSLQASTSSTLSRKRKQDVKNETGDPPNHGRRRTD